MIVCIEPMVTTNSIDYKISSNMWTISSKNNLVTCHWEHMLLVTKDGCEVLTE
jgi:methionyl aminopeptidase